MFGRRAKPKKEGASAASSGLEDELSSEEFVKKLRSEGVAYHYGRGHVRRRQRNFTMVSPYRSPVFRLGLLACVLVVVVGVFAIWLEREGSSFRLSRLELESIPMEGEFVVVELQFVFPQGGDEVLLRGSIRPKLAPRQRIVVGTELVFRIRSPGKETFEERVVFEDDVVVSASVPAVVRVWVPKFFLTERSVLLLESKELGLDERRSLAQGRPATSR